MISTPLTGSWKNYKPVKNSKDCPTCLYIKDTGFPFIEEEGVYYVDSENCFPRDNNILTKFCPTCGKKIDKPRPNTHQALAGGLKTQ